MELKDWVTLGIASLSLVISIILGYREIIRERRRISINLEYLDLQNVMQVFIVNIGQRPITLTDLSMETQMFGEGEEEYYEKIRGGSLYNLEPEEVIFPVTLSDGDHVSIPLSDLIIDRVISNRLKAKITVFDAEGNEYKKFKLRHHDKKWGGYYKD